ncbi:cytochrome-c peroxidase, partial [Thioclava sp. BHET1]
ETAVTNMLATGDHAAKTGNTAANPVPRGGMFWDGRADTLQAQVMGPMMSPFEMANPSRKAVYEVLKARYGATLKQLFGPNVLADQNQTLDEAAFTLSRYQVEDPSFHPYSSKYDAYLAGKAKLSAAEATGLKLFDDPNKGNCAACHLDQMNGDGTPPMFTDYEYEALGVPRNRAIPANHDPKFFDLGICGPLRGDIYA